MVVRCRECHAVFQSPTALPVGNPYAEHAPDDYFSQHDAQAKIRVGRGARGRGGATPRRPRANARDRLWPRRVPARRARTAGGSARASSSPRPTPSGRDASTACGRGGRRARRAVALRTRGTSSCMAAVLEHLYEPMPVLEAGAGRAAAGGLVYIDVPERVRAVHPSREPLPAPEGPRLGGQPEPDLPAVSRRRLLPAEPASGRCDSAGLETVQVEPYAMENCMANRTGGRRGHRRAGGVASGPEARPRDRDERRPALLGAASAVGSGRRRSAATTPRAAAESRSCVGSRRTAVAGQCACLGR